MPFAFPADGNELLSFPPLPRRHRLRIGPQAFLSLACVLLQPFQHRISRHSPCSRGGASFGEIDIRLALRRMRARELAVGQGHEASDYGR